MLKKVLSIVLALTMIASFNAFALSSSEVLNSDTQAIMIGENAGVEAVLTKDSGILTVDVELVGELNLLTCVQSGFKYDTTKLTYVSMETSEEFATLATNWTNGCSDGFATMGYVVGAYTANSRDYAINVAADERTPFMTFKFAISETEDINSNNYEDIISFNWDFFAQTWLTIDLDKLNIDAATI